MDDVLLRDAVLVDGTGAPARRADILVRSGRIDAVEAPGGLEAPGVEVLDTDGATVTPGFIDVHSHADNAPFLEAEDTSKILQGVTTEVVGNCGFSLAPHAERTAQTLEEYALRIFPPVPWSWRSFGELLAAADERGYVTNYVPLVGHHALRIASIAMVDRAPDAAELDEMGGLLEEAMAAGAFGLSTGLIYPPGLFSQTDELVALARRLPPGTLYATHMRGEGRSLLDSIAEALRIGEESGRRVQVSHLKASGRQNWALMPEALEMLDAARARGVDVHHDVYPYTAGSTMLTATLPPWFQEGGDAGVLRRLGEPASLERLRKELGSEGEGWENFVYGAGWEGVVVASSASHRFDGQSLKSIAEQTGVDPVDALVDLLVAEQLQVSMIVHSQLEENLVLAMRHPETMIGSDGLPPGVGGKPHPRTYGTFPRLLGRYVRDGVLSLEDAVRKMTSLPARTFALQERGTVASGMIADLVAFDPATVVDTASYDDPVRTPEGISWVMQNGRIVVRDGTYLGGRHGHRLVPAGA